MAALDLTQDYLYVDGLEAVELKIKRGGTATEGQIPNAKRFKVDRSMRSYTGGMQLQGDELLWAISAGEMKNIGITDMQARDVFSATDANYSVVAGTPITFQPMTGMWWAVTRVQPPQGG